MLEIPYVAGLFDGEGYITINKWEVPGRDYIRYQLFVGVSMTDKPIIEMLAAQFGGMCANYKKQKQPNHRRVFCWKVSSKSAVPFLRQTIPYLRVKREQAELVLRFQEHVTANSSVFKYQPERRAELYEYREAIRQELKRLHKVSYTP